MDIRLPIIIVLIITMIIVRAPVFGSYSVPKPQLAHIEADRPSLRIEGSNPINLQNLVSSKIDQAQRNFTWRSLGPGGISSCGVQPFSPPDAWDPVSGNLCSGRVTSIAIDPKNPNTIYVGSAGGGVWKSQDGGSSWRPLTDNLYPLAVGSIAIDPNGVVYVGTGEGNNNADSHFGLGILKSTDGGNTWVREGAETFGKLAFTKIAINEE